MADVVVIDGGYDSYEFEEAACNENGLTFDVFSGDRHDRDAKITLAQDAIGIMLRWTIVDDAFLKALPNVKSILRYGVGYDNVDLEAARRHGVRVSNVQGYASHSVSDHALALMLSCSRALPRGQASFQTQFAAPPIVETIDLHDKTLGIIGLGRIGSALSHKAANIFDRVLAVDPYITQHQFNEAGATACDLPTLLRESHVISLHCNLTEETHHILDEAAFDAMKQGTIIINTARGPVLDWRALQAALEADRIHSAGLDVFDDEPPGTEMDSLLNDPRVIATGHYAWYSIDAMRQLQKKATDNLMGLIRGEIVEDELTELD